MPSSHASPLHKVACSAHLAQLIIDRHKCPVQPISCFVSIHRSSALFDRFFRVHGGGQDCSSCAAAAVGGSGRSGGAPAAAAAEEDGGGGRCGRQRAQLLRARVDGAPRGGRHGGRRRARHRPRQAVGVLRRQLRRARSRRGDEVRGGRPAQDGRGRRRQGAPSLHRQLGARSDRGGGRGAQVRALQRRRQAPRRPARRRQPWLRRHQEGFPGERERLLRAPPQLLRHDSEAPQVQMLTACLCQCQLQSQAEFLFSCMLVSPARVRHPTLYALQMYKSRIILLEKMFYLYS